MRSEEFAAAQMKTIYNIYKVRARVLLWLVACMLAMACSGDSETERPQELKPEEPQQPDSPQSQESDLLQLVAYTRSYRDLTRGFPSGYATYTPDDVTSIGIFMTPQITDTPGYFLFDGLKWSTAISVKQQQYYLYGFMPGGLVTSSSVRMLDGETSYAAGARLTLRGMLPIGKSDICVVTGVQGVPSSTSEPNVQLGAFSYAGQSQGQNYVCLLMDHLYACLQFKIKVNATYDELRTVKLKRVELRADKVSAVNAVITLKANSEGVQPIASIQWTQSTGQGASITLYEEEEGDELSAVTAKEINAQLVPNLDDYLYLTSTYDVYDKAGNLVRRDCTATNRLPATLLLNTLKSGERQPISLTVNPTYLYVLSEPDLDNPSINIE